MPTLFDWPGEDEYYEHSSRGSDFGDDVPVDDDYDDDADEKWYRNNRAAGLFFAPFEASGMGGEEGTNFGNLGEAYDQENHPGSGSSSPGGSGTSGNVYDVSNYPTYDRTYHMQEEQNDPAVATNPFNSSKVEVVDITTNTVLAVCVDRVAGLQAIAALTGGSPFLAEILQLRENPGR